MKFVDPHPERTAFTCPHSNCGVYAEQTIFTWLHMIPEQGSRSGLSGFSGTLCKSCDQHIIWQGLKMVYPIANNCPPANEDMPSNVLGLYSEAAEIHNISPRASAALLRLALDRLCTHLGAPDKDSIDKKIGYLVSQGLPKGMQEIMDTTRFLGNEAVHIGEIDVDGIADDVAILFRFLNTIVERLITNPMKDKELYNLIPANKKQGIENRNEKALNK